MGWTGEILNGVGGFKKIGVSLGDLEQALGRSTAKSHIQLIGDVVQSGSNWVFANAINVMAKYKAFRDSNATFASFAARNTARANAIYGFNRPSTFNPGSAGALVMPTDWTYNRPVSISNGVVSINTPLRAEDFIKDTSTADAGYDPNAISPIAVDFEGSLVLNGMSIIRLWKDAGVNNYWSDKPGVVSMPWQPDRSLSVQELLGSGSSSIYDNKYVAFVFYDTTSGSTAVTWITTNVKISDISTVGVFLIYANGNGSDNPEVPLLKEASRDGHTFTVAACLSSTKASGTKNYEVISSAIYSMAWDTVRRTDRQTLTARSTKSVDYLTGTITAPTLTKDTSYSSDTWDKYNLSVPINGSVSAASGWSSGSSVNIITRIAVNGGLIGTSPTSSDAVQTLSVTKSTTVNTGSAQTKTLCASSDVKPIYIIKGASNKAVTISAEFSQSGNTKGFTNTVVLNPS